MHRAQHVQKLLEDMSVLQQKMLAKHRLMAQINKITFSQWRVLEIIDRAGKASIKEIHTQLGITSSAATQLVNELVKKAYVKRRTDTRDARVSAVVLTPAMRTALRKLKDQNLKLTVQLFGALNDKEFKHFITLHKKIINSI